MTPLTRLALKQSLVELQAEADCFKTILNIAQAHYTEQRALAAEKDSWQAKGEHLRVSVVALNRVHEMQGRLRENAECQKAVNARLAGELPHESCLSLEQEEAVDETMEWRIK